MGLGRTFAAVLTMAAISIGAIALGSVASDARAFYAPNLVRIPSLEARERPGPVDFSHWSHNQYQCFGCHPALFPQARLGFTHDAMAEGRFCGACHDGKLAFKSRSRCSRCHGGEK
ncbi:MAG: c(7)-type cytochrome triheme domain-containing protein [Myxococcota bacterium]